MDLVVEQNIDIEIINSIAVDAGKIILEIYNESSENFDISKKADDSPLTKADIAANNFIVKNLTKHYPNIPIISEENKSENFEVRKNWNHCWLVDPLDGTKEFIKRNGEFTVNIALIENGNPILGVVYAPDLDLLYYCDEAQSGSYKCQDGKCEKLKVINTNYLDLDEIKVVASRSHFSEPVKNFIDNLEKQNKKIALKESGSSLKICMIADGSADVYPRLAPTMEWDTAAAHAVLLGVGKNLLQTDETLAQSEPVIYNKKNLLNPWFISS